MKVLVVEDAPRLANTIARGLRTQGIAVDIAYDGHEAAGRLELYPYDVVVLDRDLPGIHGDTLCRMITESEKPAMILMLTAAGTPDERVAGSRSALTTTCPSRFISPSWCCASAGSLGASRPPRAASFEQSASSSTHRRGQ